MPLPTNGYITTNFYTPVSYIPGRTTHEALDIVTKGSQKIFAPAAGTVIKVIDLYEESTKTGFGNEIWIRHENGLETRFCHLTRYSTLGIGTVVKAGQVIAYTGRTGYRVPTSVYHTHYEVYDNGKRIDPLKVQWSQPTNPTKRMKITETQRAVYVRSAPDSKTFDIYVIVKHDKEPFETRHAVKNAKGLVATVFGMNEAWKKVEWAEIQGLTEGEPYDINNLAITKPGSFLMQ
jgi:hypothetical protein